MLKTIKAIKPSFRIALADIGAILFIYLIPSIAHFSPFPLYYAEPMRVIAIMGYFLSRNQLNAYLIAISLPIFSLLFSGHPTLFKASLISVELFLNILFLHILMVKYSFQSWSAIIMSILGSKVFYYTLKYLFITLSLLHGEIISIPIYIQLTATVIIAFIFYLTLKLNKH